MSVPDLIRVVSPLLRCVRTNDIDRFDRFFHDNDCLLRRQHQTIAALQHSSSGKRDRKLQAGVRFPSAMSLPAIFPCQGQRIATITFIDYFCWRSDLFNDCHNSKKENTAAREAELLRDRTAADPHPHELRKSPDSRQSLAARCSASNPFSLRFDNRGLLPSADEVR